jgi:hypothetical protein
MKGLCNYFGVSVNSEELVVVGFEITVWPYNSYINGGNN